MCETLGKMRTHDMLRIDAIVGLTFNPIRSKVFQTANDPEWGRGQSRKLMDQSSPYDACAFY